MERKFTLSCCSTVDLPYSYMQSRDIPVLFYTYVVDGQEYVDDMGRDPEALPRFYRFLEAGKLPQTSQINVGTYLDFFEAQLEKGDLLHIAFTSGQSGSVHNAVAAAKLLQEKYPDKKLVVIDSLCSSSGYGLLVDAAADLPLELCTRPQLNALLRAAEVLSGRESLTVQAAAMLLLDHVHTSMPRQKRPLKILQEMDCGNMSLALLREDICAGGLTLQETQVSDIFLDNLKTATPWIIKQVNLRLLTDDARNDHGSALHIATHLSNLIKVSDRVTVRHGAGLALLEIAPRLTVDQRNEVSVELCRGLELGQQEPKIMWICYFI